MTLPMGRAMREVFGETVSALADDDQRIVMLDGDLGTSTRAEIFARAHPERFLEMGIAEQNMLGVAAGLASGIYSKISDEVIRPTPAEQHSNPRSAPAKLRWARRAK